jgi:sporulation protein YlmC with PRC-barrel domain
MTTKLSKLFGMDIYSDKAEYKGKVFDIVINLEKGRLETITTEALKARTKQEAKRIISEKSIPYRNVKAVKDIVLISSKRVEEPEEEVPEEKPTGRYPTRYKFRR